MEKGEREPIEWTNTWWAEANTDCKRGLLIGDSTTRQLRGSIEILLRNLYAVDLFAASFSIHDSRLADHMELLFQGDEYQYDFIVLNYGGHHGFSRLCSADIKEYRCYQKQYQKLLRRLMRECPKVICVTGASEVLDTDVHTIDLNIEQEIVARNQIVHETARENGVAVFDLYALMAENRGVYAYTDRQHFKRDSDYFISYHMLEFMLTQNILCKELVNRQRLQDKNRLLERLGNDKACVIYGVGLRGSELYWRLQWYGLGEEISCFVVTDYIAKDHFFEKEIIRISELGTDARENSTLIIASDNYKDEMYQTAVRLQIKHIVFYDDILNSLLTHTESILL